MSKIDRKTIYQKYNGRCAYCGIELGKEWNVDHIQPKVFGGSNELDNLNPACHSCNNYKGAYTLEEFRNNLKKILNEKPEYLFKSKTKMLIAKNMGVISMTEWDGKFYFERGNK